MKLDEGLRDGAEVKKKKVRRKHMIHVHCTTAEYDGTHNRN